MSVPPQRTCTSLTSSCSSASANRSICALLKTFVKSVRDVRATQPKNTVSRHLSRRMRNPHAQSQYPPNRPCLNSLSQASILSSVGLKKHTHFRWGSRSIPFELLAAGGYAAALDEAASDEEEGSEWRAGLSIRSVR